MSDEVKTSISFAGFTLDFERGRLLHDGRDIDLRAKSMALLMHMARNEGRVVPKDELLDALWPDVIVTEDSLTQCVHDVRRALGDDGPALLRTLPRRGYLLTIPASPATVTGSRGNPIEKDDSRQTPPLRRDGVVILPFVLEGPDDIPTQRLLDGLTHDVISRLSRLRSFQVIARGSSFALRHLASDPAQAGRLLGVAYAVGGSAETHGEVILVRFDVIDVATGHAIWTEEFREKRQDFEGTVARLTERIVQKVNAEVTSAEVRKALALGNRPLDAWQSYHSGLHAAFRFEIPRLPEALKLFEHAVALDPGFARAHAAQSFCHFLHAFIHHGEERPLKIAAALRASEEAMRVDDSNPSSHWAYGRALWLKGNPESGLNHLRTAIDISPSYALAHYFTGLIEALHGSPQSALVHLDTGKALSPLDPFAPSMEIMRAMALVRLGDLGTAADHAGRAAQYMNAHEQILAPAAMILAEAEELEMARGIVDRIRVTSPNYQASQLNKTLYGMPSELVSLFHRNAAKLGM